jgi:hypothetical protein
LFGVQMVAGTVNQFKQNLTLARKPFAALAQGRFHVDLGHGISLEGNTSVVDRAQSCRLSRRKFRPFSHAERAQVSLRDQMHSCRAGPLSRFIPSGAAAIPENSAAATSEATLYTEASSRASPKWLPSVLPAPKTQGSRPSTSSASRP